MKTDILQNPVVRTAIEALQKGDKSAWAAQFEVNAKFFDDGQPRELARFSQDALGHERFSTIEHVSADGLELRGQFHSDQWGDFRTYFRFTLSAGGRIAQLDIGQA